MALIHTQSCLPIIKAVEWEVQLYTDEDTPIQIREGHFPKMRLYLQTPGRGDVTSYIRHLWSDEEIMEYVGGIHVMDDERAIHWYDSWIEPGREDRRYFLIMLKNTDIPIGECYFHSFNQETKTACYGMNIEAKHRGNGYSTEVFKLLLDFYFDEFGGEMVVDAIALDNIRAQHIFLKYGFEHDPSLGDSMTSVGGDDVFWVRIDKDKFEQLHKD
ncbi:MAG: GNAT family N-acetyltransferase [Bacilli bacterium]